MRILDDRRFAEGARYDVKSEETLAVGIGERERDVERDEVSE